MKIRADKNTFATDGHVDPVDFAAAVAELYEISVDPDKVKHDWECMRFENGAQSFRPCSAIEFGARPITTVKIGEKCN